MASATEGDVGTATEPTRVLQWGFQELSLNNLATSLGASEQALRLIISIFLGDSKCGLGTSSISISEELVRNANLKSTPDLLNEKP